VKKFHAATLSISTADDTPIVISDDDSASVDEEPRTANSTSSGALGRIPQMRQTTFQDLKWKVLNEDEKQQQMETEMTALRSQRAITTERDQCQRDDKARKKKDNTRETRRKRKSRVLKKALKEATTLTQQNVNDVLTGQGPDTSNQVTDHLADTSQPGAIWRNGRNGKKNGTVMPTCAW
jgi:uncharacterized membrane protein YgaE (UPF0421/DUF939 family)